MAAIRSSLLALVLAACAPAAPPPAPEPSPCHVERFEEADFTVCDPGRGRLQLVAAGKDERPARSFADLRLDPARVAFAMNAGMFDEDGRPIGLAIADGEVKHPLNLRDGYGNFHLKPNGVFLVTRQGTPMVVDSEAMKALKFDIALATQSGPLLVSDNAVHPKIAPDGDSRYVRNGVGVRDGHALFVISLDAVSLGKFARFFRDRLKTPDALFFDGSVSSLWVPAEHRQDDFVPIGPIIVAFKDRAGSAPGP